MSETTLSTASIRPRRNLTLWGALGLSLGIVGPSLAMSGNGQGTAAAIGKSVPLIFLLAAIGVMFIAHGFVRLTQRFNQAGSAYALVGKTLGPRAGFFAGWGVMVTYLFFAIGNVGAIGSFVNAFVANAQGNPMHPFRIPWLLSGGVGLVLAALLATREFKNIVRTLLIIEGVGVASMTILCVVIFTKGGNVGHGGIDFSTFSFKGHNFTAIMGAVVGAFLSWGGFEGAAALGEETNNPSRNIPKALLTTVIGASVLFVVVMFAQTIGFGTDAAGVKAFSTSGNTLAQLGHQYVGLWFSLVLSFTAIMSSFGCLLGSAGTTGRLLFAAARDGVGPKSWGHLDRRGEPIQALFFVVAFTAVVAIVAFVSGHPVVGTGDPALDMYFYFSTIGIIALMVAYAMVEFGAIKHLLTERKEKAWEAIFAVVGLGFIFFVFYFNVKAQVTWVGAPFIAFSLVAVGLFIALLYPEISVKISTGLSRDLGEPSGKELSASSGVGRAPFGTDI